MPRITHVLAALPLLALPLLVAPTSAGAATTASSSCQAPVVAPSPSTGQPMLSDVRVGRHDDQGYDRVVFHLSGPTGYRVNYVPSPITMESGAPLTVRGTAVLAVRLEPAVAHTEAGMPSAPLRIQPPYRAVREVRTASDFEGVVTYAVGVAERSDFRVFTLSSPSRLVVDVAAPGQHPFDCRGGAVRVYFFDSNAELASVSRRVPTPAVARGALTALFAGPTAQEHAKGLRLITSDATGFSALSITSGTARVQLTGGCNAHGSTATIASEITQTLRQFSSVVGVKVYDPSGNTEVPTGPGDSIPECLEP